MRFGSSIFLPVLLSVHLLFLFYALAKRAFKCAVSLLPGGRRTNSRRLADLRPPRHLALILVPGSSRRTPLSSWQARQDRATFLKSVETAVEWCAAQDIPEISMWDTGRGLTEDSLEELQSRLVTRPPSPPSSSASASGLESPGIKQRHMPRPLHGRQFDDVVTLNVWVHADKSTKPSSITLHLLPPSSSSSYISVVARQMAANSSPLSKITEANINGAVRDALHFESDPELLVIHHMRPGVGLRRSAPELYGYPFWPLRITEIYQHASPLPRLWQAWSTGTEPLRIAALEGAMDAWSRVEQRLGR